MQRRPTVPTRRAASKAPRDRINRPIAPVKPGHRKLPPQRGK
jgi:hypothetical protein